MSNKRIQDELDYQRITEIEKLEKELDEQLLVNGKGQQRELKLMTERDKLKRQLDELKDHFVSKTENDDQEAEIAKFKAELKAAREEIQNLKDGDWPIVLSEAGGEIDRLNARLTEAREVLTYHGPNTMPLTYGPYMGGAAQPLIQHYSPALGQITNELKEIKKLLELIGTRIG